MRVNEVTGTVRVVTNELGRYDLGRITGFSTRDDRWGTVYLLMDKIDFSEGKITVRGVDWRFTFDKMYETHSDILEMIRKWT
ncbi:MAG: hypothetical protein KGI08_11555 [Thaumarchaeota archaeon]|nr:hypothetical protein [Nitrososphaerota archaeon]